jgi:hypothetical protein
MTTGNQSGFEASIVFDRKDEMHVDLLVSAWTWSLVASVVEDSISQDGIELDFFCVLPFRVAVLFVYLDSLGVVAWDLMTKHVDGRRAEGM